MWQRFILSSINSPRYAVHTQTPLLSTGTEHPDSMLYHSASAPVYPLHRTHTPKNLF